MSVPQTKEELNALIANKVEEAFNLEYKAAGAFMPDGKKKDPKTELAKDVSSFANSSGGTIIYGIKEFDEEDKRHLPEKITPIDRKKFSKEWLEQVIHGNISPKIDGLHIYAVELDTVDEVVYVIEIPQSTTAHQNTADGRYYRRYNFQAVWMEDYEIRDVMNRLKYPDIELEFEIEKTIYLPKPKQTQRYAGPLNLTPVFSGGDQVLEHKTTYILNIYPVNNGKMYAQYINYFVYLPENILNADEVKFRRKNEHGIEFYGENTYRDIMDVKVNAFGPPETKYGPSRFDPILPELRGRATKIMLTTNPDRNDQVITWEVYADNAPSKKGTIKLSEIRITEKVNE